MADFPKKILLVSTMRSGTHYVAELLGNHMGIRRNGGIVFNLNKMDFDDINFVFGSDKRTLYVTHWEFIEELLSYKKLDRLNTIIKNRDIYVVFLDRKDFTEQLISRGILLSQKVYNLPESKKMRIKKSDFEKHYMQLKRIKYYNNLSRIPLSINEQIYYEDILKSGLTIADTDIKSFNTIVKKNKPKEDTITNYNDLLRWIEEFHKKYNEDWEPFLLWPERKVNE